jgi:hypothetical protein
MSRFPGSAENAFISSSSETHVVLTQKTNVGIQASELEDAGSSLIDSLVSRMSWNLHFDVWSRWNRKRVDKNIDSSNSRERTKLLHLIIRSGAKVRMI